MILCRKFCVMAQIYSFLKQWESSVSTAANQNTQLWHKSKPPSRIFLPNLAPVFYHDSMESLIDLAWVADNGNHILSFGSVSMALFFRLKQLGKISHSQTTFYHNSNFNLAPKASVKPTWWRHRRSLKPSLTSSAAGKFRRASNGWSSRPERSWNEARTGVNPMNRLQACIYKLVNTNIYVKLTCSYNPLHLSSLLDTQYFN